MAKMSILLMIFLTILKLEHGHTIKSPYRGHHSTQRHKGGSNPHQIIRSFYHRNLKSWQHLNNIQETYVRFPIDTMKSQYRGHHSTQRHKDGSNEHRIIRSFYNRHLKGLQHRKNIQKTYVRFPTENFYSITVPVVGTQWQCGRNATLIELKPTGKMGRTEYAIVKSEIDKTNKDGINFNITKIEKVKNSCLWQRYKYRQRDITSEGSVANEKMLFHGSSVANQLVHTGFDERYASFGGLFGPGVYFADLSSKSHGYTRQKDEGTRLLLLCRVTLGKVYLTAGIEHFNHAPVGYHSVKGALPQPEYIVYRGEQAYPEYLITYKP